MVVLCTKPPAPNSGQKPSRHPYPLLSRLRGERLRAATISRNGKCLRQKWRRPVEEPSASGEAGEDTKRGPGKDTPSPYTEEVNLFCRKTKGRARRARRIGEKRSTPQHIDALSESGRGRPTDSETDISTGFHFRLYLHPPCSGFRQRAVVLCRNAPRSFPRSQISLVARGTRPRERTIYFFLVR